MVLARKYRPKTLDQVIGQSVIAQTLSHAITQKRLHHAYLFEGQFGSGKTSVARILAASENCRISPGLHPCGTCDLCSAVYAGNHSDISEIDAASNAGKVEQIRELKNSATYSAMDGAKTKYYIVDESHRMSAAAEEALLKLLEEPPKKVRFVLCTTRYKEMTDTVLSRCQVHHFHKIYWREISEHLQTVAKQETLDCDGEAISLCAKLANGSMRNALQNLEKLIDFSGSSKITASSAQKAFGTVSELLFYDFIKEICKEGVPDATAGYKIINQLVISGMGANQVFEGISEVFRNVLLGVSASACAELILISEEAKGRLKELLKLFKPRMQALLSIMKGSVEARTAVEYGQSLDIALQMWFLESILRFQKGG